MLPEQMTGTMPTASVMPMICTITEATHLAALACVGLA